MTSVMTQRFTLYVDTDNAAFDATRFGADGEGPRYEIARILREAADKIERNGVAFASETIRDVNGNDVGRYALKPVGSYKNL